jgi:hypothetical protein
MSSRLRGGPERTSPFQAYQLLAAKWDTISFYGIIRLFAASVPPKALRIANVYSDNLLDECRKRERYSLSCNWSPRRIRHACCATNFYTVKFTRS